MEEVHKVIVDKLSHMVFNLTLLNGLLGWSLNFEIS